MLANVFINKKRRWENKLVYFKIKNVKTFFYIYVPTYMITVPERHWQTDRQTDGQTT